MVVRRYVRDMRFERMSSAYEADGVPNSPNPVCACRDTAISAGSHIVGASGEVLRFPSGYQEAWRGWVRTSVSARADLFAEAPRGSEITVL